MPVLKPNLLVDLDGLLADFHYGFLRMIRREDLILDYPKGVHDLPEVLGITDGQFWDLVPREFFLTLKMMDDAPALLELIRQYDPNFHICSSPGTNKPWVVAEKVHWVHKHIDPNFNRFLITKHKPIAANPRNILLDDWDQNCIEFRRAGGQAVIVPRPWNTRHGIAHDAVTTVRLQLEHLFN